MSGAAIIAMLGGFYAGFMLGCGFASMVTRRRMFEEAVRRGGPLVSRRLSTAALFARYYPLDEILENPRVRVLRALRRFDEVTAEDLRIALDIPEDDPKQGWIIATSLCRLCSDRLVVKSGVRCSFRYRITARGRRELDGILARGTAAGGRRALSKARAMRLRSAA